MFNKLLFGLIIGDLILFYMVYDRLKEEKKLIENQIINNYNMNINFIMLDEDVKSTKYHIPINLGINKVELQNKNFSLLRNLPYFNIYGYSLLFINFKELYESSYVAICINCNYNSDDKTCNKINVSRICNNDEFLDYLLEDVNNFNDIKFILENINIPRRNVNKILMKIAGLPEWKQIKTN
jgi:hypothetical protein